MDDAWLSISQIIKKSITDTLPTNTRSYKNTTQRSPTGKDYELHTFDDHTFKIIELYRQITHLIDLLSEGTNADDALTAIHKRIMETIDNFMYTNDYLNVINRHNAVVAREFELELTSIEIHPQHEFSPTQWPDYLHTIVKIRKTIGQKIHLNRQ